MDAGPHAANAAASGAAQMRGAQPDQEASAHEREAAALRFAERVAAALEVAEREAAAKTKAQRPLGMVKSETGQERTRKHKSILRGSLLFRRR